MGYKTERPDGRRHHARNLTIRDVQGKPDFLVLGCLDVAALVAHAKRAGLDLDGVDVQPGWWTLTRGVSRRWVYDDEVGDPGIYAKVN